MNGVEVRGLRRTYNSVHAVDGVSLDIEPGELLVLLGPSGCGKTTLLRSISGLERPDSGRIVVGDDPVFDSEHRISVPTHKRDIGMVFQNYVLWPHMTVAENVAYPLRWRRIPKADQRTRVREALETVECGALADRRPSALSGGQQQRVALARAIVAQPRLMLFDEPLSNLDARLRVQLRHEIRDLHRTLGFTGIYVTHDQSEALQLGTRVAIMRAGRIEQLDPARTVFSQPRTPFVAEFLGIENRLLLARTGDTRWTCEGLGVDVSSLDLGSSAAELDMYVRAGDINLRSPGDPLSTTGELALGVGKVSDVVFAGNVSEWAVDLGQRTVRAVRAPSYWPFARGDEVVVSCSPDRCLLYERGRETA